MIPSKSLIPFKGGAGALLVLALAAAPLDTAHAWGSALKALFGLADDAARAGKSTAPLADDAARSGGVADDLAHGGAATDDATRAVAQESDDAAHAGSASDNAGGESTAMKVLEHGLDVGQAAAESRDDRE